MTGDRKTEAESAPPQTSKQPPIAGTVAGRVPVPAISSDDDPASPGADADRRQAGK
jgi:hypothetical protein